MMGGLWAQSSINIFQLEIWRDALLGSLLAPDVSGTLLTEIDGIYNNICFRFPTLPQDVSIYQTRARTSAA